MDNNIQIGSVEGVGIAIGHGASVNIYGDVHYAPIKLRTGLRHQFDLLLQNYVKLFAGRQKELAFIGQTISDSTGGYLVITAPAGFGKTALMAALVQRTPQAFAYHFFNPAYMPISLDETSFLRNVVEQIAQWHGKHKQEIPERLDQLVALYYQMLKEELDHTRILVLDGVDEISAWSIKKYFVHPLPKGLHILVTIRDSGQDWMQAYGFPPEQINHLPLGGLSRAGVGEVLGAAGPLTAELAKDSHILSEIMRIAAYPAKKSLGADPFYVRLLAEDMATNSLKADEIGKRPNGLSHYLDRWWKQIIILAGDTPTGDTQTDNPTEDLFGTLAAALGPITRADLEAVNASLNKTWRKNFFDDVIKHVRRFVFGDSQTGYRLVHPRLQIYLCDQIHIDQYEKRLTDYCAKWHEHHSPYALAFYAPHLANLGRLEDLFKLISPEWMLAKYTCFQSQRSFAEDLTLITKKVVDMPRPSYLKPLVLACLVHAELVVQSPPEIMAVLAQIGQVTRALDYAAMMPDINDRVEAYRQISRALQIRGELERSQETLLLALQTAQIGSSAFNSRRVLKRLVQDLESAQLDVPPEIGLLPVVETDEDDVRRRFAVNLAQNISQTKSTTTIPFTSLLGRIGNVVDRSGRLALIAQFSQLLDQERSPEKILEAVKQSLVMVIDRFYPDPQGPLLHDVAQVLAQAGLAEWIWQLADLSPNDTLRAWMIAHLAIGLARAGENQSAITAAKQALEMLNIDISDGATDIIVTITWDNRLDILTLTATAQAFALADEFNQAEKVANMVLAGIKASGFEVEKAQALKAIALALIETSRQKKAVEAVQLALSVAETILDEEFQAEFCEELVRLMLVLNQGELAKRAAELLLPSISFVGAFSDIDFGAEIMANCGRAFATVSSPEEVARRLRDDTGWEYDMEGDEITAIIGAVAVKLVESGETAVAVALAKVIPTIWLDVEAIADIVTALLTFGNRTEVDDLVQNMLEQIAQFDDDEETTGLMIALVEALAAGGAVELAQETAAKIPITEERQLVLADIDEVTLTIPTIRPIVADQMEQNENDIREPYLGQESQLSPDVTTRVANFNDQLLRDGLPDQVHIFDTLVERVNDIVALDAGDTLSQLLESIQKADRWMSNPPRSSFN